MSRLKKSRMLRVSLFKSYLTPMLVLAVLTLLIPFIIREHTIYTTQYVYSAMIIPVFAMWYMDFALEGINNAKFFDWMMTFLIFLLCPISIIVGLIALSIIFFFPKTVYFAVWLVASVTVFLLGVRPIYVGNINKWTGSFIAVLNHGSFLDYFFVPLIMGYKIPWKVVYGKNLEKYPIIRYFVRRYGIGVDRSSPESRLQASLDIMQALKEGFSVAIFPEGTRMRGHQFNEILLPFRNGAFKASIESGRPIIPVTLSLPILYSKPEKPLPLSPCKIIVSFGHPIYPENFTIPNLKQEVYDLMKDELIKSNNFN